MGKTTIESSAVKKFSIYNDGEVAVFETVRLDEMLAMNFKTDVLVVFYCKKGRASFVLNTNTVEIFEGDMAFCPADTFVNGVKTSEEMKCLGIFISDSYFKRTTPIHERGYLQRRFFDQTPVLHLTDRQRKVFGLYYDLIKMKAEIFNINNINSVGVMDSILTAFMQDIKFSVESSLEVSDTEIKEYSHADNIFKRFLSLISDARHKRTSIIEYAEILNITPKYLSEVCKKVSGESASQIVRDYVLREIEQLIYYSDMSMKEIADTLGFPNLSFFGNYVRKYLGASPNSLRKKKK